MESPRESESSKDRGRYKSCKKKERVLTPPQLASSALTSNYFGGIQTCIYKNILRPLVHLAKSTV